MLVTAKLLSRARLHDDTFEIANLVNAFLYAKHDIAQLGRRIVTARKNLNLCLTWLDAGEKLNALSVAAICPNDGDERDDAEEGNSDREFHSDLE